MGGGGSASSGRLRLILHLALGLSLHGLSLLLQHGSNLPLGVLVGLTEGLKVLLQVLTIKLLGLGRTASHLGKHLHPLKENLEMGLVIIGGPDLGGESRFNDQILGSLILRLIHCFLVWITQELVDQGRVINLQNGSNQGWLIHERIVGKALKTGEGFLVLDGLVDAIGGAGRMNCIGLFQGFRRNFPECLLKGIAQVLFAKLAKNGVGLTENITKGDAEDASPKIGALAHEGSDLGNLRGSTGILGIALLGQAEVRHGGEIFRDHTLIDHLLIKADRGLGHGDGLNANRKDCGGAELQVVRVGDILLTAEQRPIIQSHRIGFFVHQLAHIRLKRSHDLANASAGINALVLDLHDKRDKGQLAVGVGKLKRGADILVGGNRTERMHENLSVLGALIDFPDNDLVVLASNGDALTAELGILNGGKLRSLVNPPLDAADKFLVLIIELVALILIQAHRNHMAQAVTGFDITGVIRNDGIDWINRIKPESLGILVPRNLQKIEAAHQHCVNRGQDLRFKIGVLFDLIIKESGNGLRDSLVLALDWDERGNHLIGKNLLIIKRLELPDDGISQRIMQVGLPRQFLFPAKAVMAHLIPNPLPFLPASSGPKIIQ